MESTDVCKNVLLDILLNYTDLPTALIKYCFNIWHVRKISIDDCNIIRWLDNSSIHRKYKPAYINVDGTARWFINGVHHRDNKPADIYHYINISYTQGNVMFGESKCLLTWQKNDRIHRKNKPAMCRPQDRSYKYIYYGKIHRIHDKPAIVTDRLCWYLHYCLYRRYKPTSINVNNVCWRREEFIIKRAKSKPNRIPYNLAETMD